MIIQTLVQRVQHNHALEHATINLLSRRYPKAQIMGLSGPLGFTLYSTLTAEDIIPAAREALQALKAGDVNLAIHENCGTNLVITAAMTTLATLVGFGGLNRSRERHAFLKALERLPQAVLFNAVAIIAAMPLARWVQANVTTNPDVHNIEIASFFTDYQGGLRRIRVHTRARAGH
jgi:hypothetical protein